LSYRPPGQPQCDRPATTLRKIRSFLGSVIYAE
jgi:hypothetical protein